MILSTDDHQELMQNVAAKTAAQFSLIPSVPSSYSQENTVDHLQAGELHWDTKHSSKRSERSLYS